MKKTYIGHFLYHQEKHLVYKYALVDSNELEFYFSEMLGHVVKRDKTLHKDILTDYDLDKCRGRVFYFKDLGPVIVVGKWILSYPEALGYVCSTFGLDIETTPVFIHKHWNIENNTHLI